MRWCCWGECSKRIKLLKFRKSYFFEVNEVSEVIATLEVNDNRNEH